MNMQNQPEFRSTKHVLVVDDEAEIRDLFGDILASAGWTVDKAGSTDEAMILFSTNAYDLITLDYSMPGMTGGSFQQAISHLFGYGKRVSSLLPPRIPPILIVTGHYDEDEVQRLVFGERVVGIMRKPVMCDKLIEIANELYDYDRSRKSRRAQAMMRLSNRLVKSDE